MLNYFLKIAGLQCPVLLASINFINSKPVSQCSMAMKGLGKTLVHVQEVLPVVYRAMQGIGKELHCD